VKASGKLEEKEGIIALAEGATFEEGYEAKAG
jgi:hypothetical protein